MSLFGFGKKKEEERSILPELPTSKEDLKLPSIKDFSGNYSKVKEESVLPSLPDSESGEKFSREAIKQIIKEPEEGMQKSKFDSIESPAPSIKPVPVKLLKPIPAGIKINEKPMVKKIEPIYVRLDKFQITAEAFNEIKDKIEDIEEILKKTKDIRAKEEQEIEKWEREIQTIKARIDAIDKNIFQNID